MNQLDYTRDLSQRLDRIAEFASRIATTGDLDLSGSSERSTSSLDHRVQTIRSLSSSPSRRSPLGYSSSEHHADEVRDIPGSAGFSIASTVQVRESSNNVLSMTGTDPDHSSENIIWPRSIRGASSGANGPEVSNVTSPLYRSTSPTVLSSVGILQTPVPTPVSHPSIEPHISDANSGEELHRPRSLPSERSPLLPLYHSNLHHPQSHSPISININVPTTPVRALESRQASNWAASNFPNVWAVLLETILCVTPRQWVLAGVGLIYLGHYSQDDLREVIRPLVCFFAGLFQVSLGQCATSVKAK